MLTESDLVEIMECHHAGDDAKLLELFQRFDPHDWVSECNEWKENHAQEFSDFLQHVISILPPESTSILDVLTLCENYTRPSGSPLIDIDLAIQTIVAFWNRQSTMEEEDFVVQCLTLLMMHSNNEYVTELVRDTVGIADRVMTKHSQDLMAVSHVKEIQECFRAGDDAKLLEAFQRLIDFDDRYGSFYEWSDENAEECSAFIQHIISLLPPSTPVEVVSALCGNYFLGLTYLPHAIDISATAFVDFWNRKRAAEDREAIEFLSALLAHPKGEYVRETLQITAGSLATRLDIDEN
ncbi:MAG: hypothetical protein ACFNXY_08735 [Corynebacterium matruchotii]|uniref:hypothetical protein n=1 Tax=Corynebacterium matruchotii TaxID=43768 RepID=UPI003613622C